MNSESRINRINHDSAGHWTAGENEFFGEMSDIEAQRYLMHYMPLEISLPTPPGKTTYNITNMFGCDELV